MEKTVSELEQPIVDLEVDQSAVDKNTTTKYGRGRVHVHARAQMPEKQLFSYAEYEQRRRSILVLPNILIGKAYGAAF